MTVRGFFFRFISRFSSRASARVPGSKVSCLAGSQLEALLVNYHCPAASDSGAPIWKPSLPDTKNYTTMRPIQIAMLDPAQQDLYKILCDMMCGIVFAVFQEVRLVSRERTRRDEIAYSATKTAMKCYFHSR
jgi:hypothetical protein